MTQPIISNQFRLIPRDADFLDRKLGSRGEVYFDRDNNTLRLYDAETQGGNSLAKADLTNVSNEDFSAKAASAGIGAGDDSTVLGGSTTVTVGDTLPDSPENGNLWLNTDNGVLYVYIDDGDSEQWIQPASAGGFSGDYNDLTNAPATFTAIEGDPYVEGAYDFGANRLLYANVYSNLDDLPNPGTYHGMFAHVHSTGKAYYAHAGAWVELANKDNVGDLTGSVFADDSTLLVDGTNGTLSTHNLEQVNATNGQALIWSDSNGRWQPGNVSVDTVNIGNFTFTNSVMDTDDSSSITVTPATVFQSDLTVENELFADRAEIDILTLTGELTSQGSGTPEIVSDNEIILTAGTTINLNGITAFYGSTEIVATITGATGTVDHNFNSGAVFYHDSPGADFTANFINVPVTNNRSISIALIIDQGGTPYVPNAVEINGSSVTVDYQGGSLYSGNASSVDLVSFNLIRTGNTWTVISSLTGYA